MQVSQKNAESFLARKGVALKINAPAWFVITSVHRGYTQEGVQHKGEAYRLTYVQAATKEGRLLGEIVFSTAIANHGKPPMMIFFT